MGTDSRTRTRSDGERRAQQEALLGSLHAAVDALTICVELIHDLIEQASAALESDVAPAPRRSARISYGGGPSPLIAEDRGSAQIAGQPRTSRRSSAPASAPTRPASAPTPPASAAAGPDAVPDRRAAHTPGLLVATDLAHRGYTRAEIAERLRQRWGDEAARILRDALG